MVTQELAGAAVVVVVVVVVVVEHGLFVQTGSPELLQTQVLSQEPVKTVPGVQPPVPVVEPPVQELGQNPSEPSTWSPAAVTLVLHQGWDWSTEVHSVYTTPLYLKGKTHWAPDVAVQDDVDTVSAVHDEELVMSQSPQLLVTTVPSLDTAVAHQGTGESA